MSRDVEEIYSRLLARNYQEVLFGGLEKAKRTGRNYMAICPFHDDHNPSFSFASDKPLWHCFGCGEGGDWIRYLERKEGITFREALERLAREAGVELKDGQHDKEKWEKETERATVLEIVLDFFKKQLWMDRENKTLDYLRKERNYEDEEIEAMELGLYPSQGELENYLVNKGYSTNIINKLGLKTQGFGDTHKLVIPYRDPVGRLKGFIVRALDDQVEPKYLVSFGVEKNTPFNLHEARGQKDLIIVEGFLDALIATQRGVKGVVATGGSSFTEAQLETAIRYGAKNFILSLDTDEAGLKGTERALELISANGLKAFVVKLLSGYKDPDELMRTTKGVEVFKKEIKEAQDGFKWKAYRLLSKHNLWTDRGEQDALDEALAYEETIKDPIDSKDFLDIITNALNTPLKLLEPKIADYHAKRARRHLEEGYKEFFREGSSLLEEGKLSELREYIDEKLPDLRAKAVNRIIKPSSLQSLREFVSQTREGLKTGYESLDKLIAIPQRAITIIAGRPSHGKTTLLLNLFLNMGRLYPEQSFFFFSYKECKGDLELKLLNILSGAVIDENHNLTQIANYLRGENAGNKEIEDGKTKFMELMESGRLWIIDEPYFVDDLADILAYLAESYDIGAVFIDYIQKVKIKGIYQTRQLELQKISERILETAKELSLPIILGARLGRDRDRKDKVSLDNLGEAGDIEQDANLVIGLYNEAMEKAQDEDRLLEEREVSLELAILKNRNGIMNEKTTLTFDRPILTIKDRKYKGNW